MKIADIAGVGTVQIGNTKITTSEETWEQQITTGLGGGDQSADDPANS